MRSLLSTLKTVLEYLGGIQEELPENCPGWMETALVWGLWWTLLILVILTFSGQTSRFIYIDF